jgi:hypothetical protein
MPTSNFEERVQKRLTNSVKLRRYSFTLSAILLVLGIVLELAEGDSKMYLAILWFLLLFVGVIPVLVGMKRRRSVVLWVRFHRGEQSRMEQQFLKGAVNAWGRLVTLADTNIRSASASRSVIWLMAIMCGAAVLAAALGLIRPLTLYGGLGFAAFYAWTWIRKGRAVLRHLPCLHAWRSSLGTC